MLAYFISKLSTPKCRLQQRALASQHPPGTLLTTYNCLTTVKALSYRHIVDPVTLILTALTQGAVKAAGDVAPDAYKALRKLLQTRFAGQPAAEVVLQEHANDPATYELPLRKSLEECGIDQDQQVLALARQLLDELGKKATPSVEIGRNAKGIIGQNVSNATIIGDVH